MLSKGEYYVYLNQLRAIHKGQKKKSTKDNEGPPRGLRRLKTVPARIGKGEKISTKGVKGSVKGVTDESAKRLQGGGKDSKGVREGTRRTRSLSKKDTQ